MMAIRLAMSEKEKRRAGPRILIVDDLERIHDDYRLILGGEDERLVSGRQLLDEVSSLLNDTGEASKIAEQPRQLERAVFRLHSAYQGQEALELVRAAQAEGDPFRVAFVDMRMPPGWDGLFTIEKIREIDTEIQIVICSAYSDYSWREIQERSGRSEDVLVLKKPFDTTEVYQMASALSEKWERRRGEARQLAALEANVVNAESHAKAIVEHQQARDARLSDVLANLTKIPEREVEFAAQKVEQPAQTQAHGFVNNRLSDLSDYLAITSGKLVLARESVDLRAIIAHCAERARPLFETKFCDFDVEISAATPLRVWGDETRISRVVWALIEDVALRVREHAVQLRVQVGKYSMTECQVCISCSTDSPIGDGEDNRLEVAELLAVAMGGICESEEFGASATFDFEIVRVQGRAS
jgi:CheY-like chemotaxis protein